MGERAGVGAVNPDCPNAANPFHRCAEYCPVPAPRPSAVKLPPPSPGRAAQNGTARGYGEQSRAVQNGSAHSEGGLRPAVQDVSAHGDGDLLAAVQDDVSADSDDDLRTAVQEVSVHSGDDLRPAVQDVSAHGDGDLRPAVQNGSTHSDGDRQPRARRRDRGGGSGGLPLYVFLREGSDKDGKKVDPRCPNAANPFHVCTDHCIPKMAEAARSSEGGKSPLSIFSRHSRRSSSSSEDGSVKSGGSKKADPKCPNDGNPFHECAEYCTAKIKEVERQKGTDKRSPRKKGGKEVAAIQNWKVDPRCPNASNPFHICAQYCFDHLSEAPKKDASKTNQRKGKAVLRAEQTGEIRPDCANASNPYHKCGEYCKRK